MAALANSDDQNVPWAFTLVWSFVGGFDAISIVFLMTFVAFSLFHSRQLIVRQNQADGDIGFDIMYRYTSTFFFKLHAAAYIIAVAGFVIMFCFKNFG